MHPPFLFYKIIQQTVTQSQAVAYNKKLQYTRTFFKKGIEILLNLCYNVLDRYMLVIWSSVSTNHRVNGCLPLA